MRLEGDLLHGWKDKAVDDKEKGSEHIKAECSYPWRMKFDNQDLTELLHGDKMKITGLDIRDGYDTANSQEDFDLFIIHWDDL